MKILKSLWILSLILFCAPPLWAQWVINLSELDQQLDSICVGIGNPLADGTEIRIYHDWNSNGPDNADTLLRICDNPPDCLDGPTGSVNYNTFSMNGTTDTLCMGISYPGGFNTLCPPMEIGVVSSGAAPTPNRIYLRVCFGSRHYDSEILQPPDGINDIEIGSWTCVEAPCPGCETPATPQNFRASDSTSCSGVTLHWHFSPADTAFMDSVFLYRDGQPLGRVRANLTDTTFVDTTAPDANPYDYSAKSRHNCGGNYAFSPSAFDFGAKYPSPPDITFTGAPYGATNDSCNEVRVSWNYGTNAGVDSFIIQRNGVRVGAVPERTPTPGVMSFYHQTTDSTHALYRVCGWNPVCGVSNCSVVDTGWAKQPPPLAPTGINATDGGCNTTRVSWNPFAGATGYRVYRNSEAGCTGTDVQIGTVTASDTFYNDNSGAFGTTFGYKVSAVNTCGEGPKSACDNGYRVVIPVTVTGVSATDGTSCDTVTITWSNNNTQETGYKIRRRKASTGVLDTFTVAADTVHYFDLSAVPGDTYYYRVVAYDSCGNGPLSGTDSLGYRLMTPLQVQNVQASDSTDCARVLVQWTNLSYEDSFQVRRSGVRIGRTLTNTVSFPDSTAHPDSIYNYTVVAYNKCGWSTESAPNPGNRRRRPGLVTGVAASDTGCTVIRLSWNALSNTDSFRIIRNDTVRARVTGATTVYNDNPAAGTYSYRILAVNACGLGDTSVVVSGTRRAPPPAVATVTASDSVCGGVQVTWTNVAGEDSFQIRRNGQRIGVVPFDTLHYTDNTAVAGTRYKYEVWPGNACLFPTATTSDSGTGHALPPTVLNVQASDSLYCWGVQITWHDSTDEDSFIVKRDGNRIGAKGRNVVSYNDSTAVAGTIYSYTVFAKNVCGLSADSTTNLGSRKGLPGLATGLTASDTACANVFLRWNDVAREDSFKIIRNGVRLAGGNAANDTDYVDASAVAGTTYAYRIVAWNFCGNGDTSAVDSGKRLAQPPAVATISATDTACGGVLVTWSNVAGEDSFQILRNGSRLAVALIDILTYNDTSAVAGTRYKYEAAAYNACGATAPTIADSGGRRAVPGQIQNFSASRNSCDSVYLAWSAVANVDSYAVYRNDTLQAKLAPSALHWTDLTATPGVEQRYNLRPWNSCGFGPWTGEIGGLRLVFPSVPVNLAATQDLCNFIRVTWASATGDVDSYRLIRDGTDSVIVSKDSTGYDDAAIPGLHTYVIKAVSAECGATAASAQVSGERLVPAGVPANVQATETRCDSIVITWDAAPGDVDGYVLYESATPLDTVGPDTLRFAYQPGFGGGYLYTVRAFSNECGPGNLSAANSGARLTLPTTVTGLTATVSRCDSVLLQWNAAGGTFDGYIVRRDAVALDTVDVPYYADTSTVGSAQYDVITYSVLCDESAPTTTVTGTRLPAPLSPDSVDATTTLCDSVIVTWNPGGGTFDEYRVYRHDTLRASLPVSVQRYAEAPRSGVTYNYKVTVWDAICGEASARDSAQGMRLSDASIPQNLMATNACDGVEVKWNKSSGAVAEYRLYRNDMPLDTILPPDTTYLDTSALRGVSYVYEVSAYSTGCGETDSSNNDDGMRLPLPVQVTGLLASEDVCSGIYVRWTAVVGTEWYRVYRDDVLIDSVYGMTRYTSYLDTNVVPRAEHEYRVGSVNICGEGDLSDSAVGHRFGVPDIVTGFFASDTSCTAVYLIWTDVATEIAYVIYRDGVAIDTTSQSVVAYVDSGAAPGAHTYTVKSMNGCGLSDVSETATGTRIPGVAQVTGVAASSGLCFTIDVQWNDLPNETGYVVWRDSVRIDTLDANVTTFSDLVAPGTYNYQITAFNVCGEGLISAVASGYRAWVPPQVTIVSATQDSCTSVTIHWTDVATEQFYLIYRTDAFVDTVDSNQTSFVDTALAPGSYIYQVRAGNYCGLGLASTGITGRVADVPTQVTGVAATNNGCTSITITWTDLADELQYQILRNDTVVGTAPKDTLHHVDTTPAIGTHSYKVRGLNSCGQGPLSAPATGVRRGPPTGTPVVEALDSACGQTTARWRPVSDVTGYTVYRDADSVGTTTDTSFVVTATPGMHGIKVRPFNACGYGPISLADSVYFVPTVVQVTGVAADTMNCLTVTVTWNNVISETGYRVLRGSTVVGTVAADTLRFVDSPPVGTYFYKVQAFNNCGSGVMSDSVRGRRRGPPDVTTVSASDTFCTQIVVSWTNVADELGYHVFQNGLPVDTVGTDTLSSTLTPPPGAYAYTVQPFNDCGLANLSAPDSGHRLVVPSRVMNVVAQNDRCDSVYIQWTDLPTETRYVVFRDADSITTLGANVLHYLDAPDMGTHSYRIRADNACGLGALSDPSSGSRVLAPTAPTVTATDALCGQINLSWTGAAGDVDGYIILRNGVPIDTVPAGTTTLTDVTTGVHAYAVIAYSNNLGCLPDTSVSDSGHGHVTAGVPTGLTFVQPEICDTIRMTWPAAGGEVEGYIVHRDGSVIDTVIPPDYADTTVDDPLPHLYAVAAYNTFCGASALSATVQGAMKWLVTPLTDVGDTLYCRDTLRAEFSHCPGVTADSFFLSVEGGPFEFLLAFVPPADTVQLIVPIADSLVRYTENCRIRILSVRGARVDTGTTDPFVIDCDLEVSDNAAEIPKEFFLDQNYPNPFNPATNIRFGVPHQANVTIEIFDILGRKMATLADGTMQPGIHTVVWDCSSCPSGMYIIRMNTAERVMLRKTLLMK